MIWVERAIRWRPTIRMISSSRGVMRNRREMAFGRRRKRGLRTVAISPEYRERSIYFKSLLLWFRPDVSQLLEHGGVRIVTSTVRRDALIKILDVHEHPW